MRRKSGEKSPQLSENLSSVGRLLRAMTLARICVAAGIAPVLLGLKAGRLFMMTVFWRLVRCTKIFILLWGYWLENTRYFDVLETSDECHS